MKKNTILIIVLVLLAISMLVSFGLFSADIITTKVFAYPFLILIMLWFFVMSFLSFVSKKHKIAMRLSGAPVYAAGSPSAPLTGPQMQALQKKLVARGHDVGGIDGILGAKTRAAVQIEQNRLGLPADAWPTIDLLTAL